MRQLITPLNALALFVALVLFVACSKSSGSAPQGGGGTNPPPPPKMAAPSITAISPDTALAGATVTITGTNFDTAAVADTVHFNGLAAVVTKSTATQLTVTVPASAATGNVTVSTPGGTTPGFAFNIAIPSIKPTVYVLGVDIQKGTGYWTNSTFTPILDNSSVYDIKGSGSDIYVAGPSTADVPTYWKNGTAVHLTSQTGYTWSIAVSGTDVYNLGIIGTNFYVWKNGTPTQLTTSSLITTAEQTYYVSNTLFVDHGDTYVAAAQYLGNSTIMKATYWKNGSPVDVTDGIHTGPAWAEAVVVSNGDVYVAGIEEILNSAGGVQNLAPRLWKNGVSIPINAPTQSFYTSVSCLLVNGNDVYVGGQYNNAGALWKNGVLLDSAKYAVAEHVSSLFLYNNTDLYASGASSAWGLNGYWVNGNFVEMDPGCHSVSNSCAATSSNQASGIYVK
jgi:uncharacterized protein (TIGR03437 family)